MTTVGQDDDLLYAGLAQLAGERYAGQVARARAAGLSAVTIESVRQGCCSDAELGRMIEEARIAEQKAASEAAPAVGVTTINIDRATRDLVVEEVFSDNDRKEWGASAFRQRDSAAVHADATGLAMFARVLDALGCEEHGDLDAYTLDVDETFRDWLIQMVDYYECDNDGYSDWSEDQIAGHKLRLAALRTVLRLLEGKCLGDGVCTNPRCSRHGLDAPIIHAPGTITNRAIRYREVPGRPGDLGSECCTLRLAANDDGVTVVLREGETETYLVDVPYEALVHELAGGLIVHAGQQTEQVA